MGTHTYMEREREELRVGCYERGEEECGVDPILGDFVVGFIRKILPETRHHLLLERRQPTERTPPPSSSPVASPSPPPPPSSSSSTAAAFSLSLPGARLALAVLSFFHHLLRC